jgi:hypothetical protein
MEISLFSMPKLLELIDAVSRCCEAEVGFARFSKFLSPITLFGRKSSQIGSRGEIDATNRKIRPILLQPLSFGLQSHRRQ